MIIHIIFRSAYSWVGEGLEWAKNEQIGYFNLVLAAIKRSNPDFCVSW